MIHSILPTANTRVLWLNAPELTDTVFVKELIFLKSQKPVSVSDLTMSPIQQKRLHMEEQVAVRLTAV